MTAGVASAEAVLYTKYQYYEYCDNRMSRPWTEMHRLAAF
jgi:hypothetical protein